MYAVSTNKITDVLHFINKFKYSSGKIILNSGLKAEMVLVPFKTVLGLEGKIPYSFRHL